MKTKNDILTYLGKHSPATIQQISRALKLTKADIRFHLNNLVDSGSITKIDTFFQNGAGRPASQYHLVTEPPGALHQIIIDVLLGNNLIQQKKSLHRSSLAQAIVEALFFDFHAYGTSATRLNAKVHHLERFGIKINWEAAKNGPKIEILREPFSLVLKDKELSTLVLKKVVEFLSDNTPG